MTRWQIVETFAGALIPNAVLALLALGLLWLASRRWGCALLLGLLAAGGVFLGWLFLLSPARRSV